MRTNKHGYNRKNLDFFLLSLPIILRVQMDRRCSIFNALLPPLLLLLFAACCCRSCFLSFGLCFRCVGRCCCMLTARAQTKWPIDLLRLGDYVCMHTPYVHKSNAQHMWNEMNNDIDDDLFVAMSLEINSSDIRPVKLCSIAE